MIYVTHDQTEAMTLADRIVVLNGGYIEQVGSPLDLYNRPSNTFVAGFIGSPRMNLLEAKVVTANGAGMTVDLAGRNVDLAKAGQVGAGDKVTLGIRPEHLDIVDEAEADLGVTVDLTEALGSETYCYATAAGLPQLTIHQMGQRNLARGEALGLKFQTDQLHLFGPDGTSLHHAG